MSFTYPDADGRLWWLHTDANGRVIDEPISPEPEPVSLEPSEEADA